MNTNDNQLMLAWSEPLVTAGRLTLDPIPEGWLASLDGFPMSYGETPRVAVTWAFIMSHKSAYE
jgi:hypothetical protein